MTYDSEFGSHISLYRDRIKQVIDDSLNEHPNSMILRVDLHDPIDTENMDNARIMVAYTYDRDQALELKKQVEEAFPNHEVICDPLSLSVACHIGPHSLAVAACKKII